MMSKPTKVVLISLASIFITAILAYLLMPIKPRLSILGYTLDDGTLGFTSAIATYSIQTHANAITAITTEDVIDGDTEMTASFSFFDDSSYAATVILEKDGDTGICTYTPGFASVLTCDNINISNTDRDTVKDRIETHLIMISFEFNWRFIPNYQR